jgi:hypothetical protein
MCKRRGLDLLTSPFSIHWVCFSLTPTNAVMTCRSDQIFDHSLVPDLHHWIALRSEVAVFYLWVQLPPPISSVVRQGTPWECKRWKRIKVFIRALNPENNDLKFLCQNADCMREVTLIGALLLRCGALGSPFSNTCSSEPRPIRWVVPLLWVLRDFFL